MIQHTCCCWAEVKSSNIQESRQHDSPVCRLDSDGQREFTSENLKHYEGRRRKKDTFKEYPSLLHYLSKSPHAGVCRHQERVYYLNACSVR